MVNLVGKKFGKLKVLEQDNTYITQGGRHLLRWKCKCDCGNVIVVRGQSLRSGHTQSCGCIKTKSTDKDYFTVYYYNRVKRRARKREQDFKLTQEQVWGLSQLPCYYCGQAPGNKTRKRGKIYTYQGIDRVDSSKGYTIDNVVPCCASCNLAKGDRSAEWFKRMKSFWSGIVIG